MLAWPKSLFHEIVWENQNELFGHLHNRVPPLCLERLRGFTAGSFHHLGETAQLNRADEPLFLGKSRCGEGRACRLLRLVGSQDSCLRGAVRGVVRSGVAPGSRMRPPGEMWVRWAGAHPSCLGWGPADCPACPLLLLAEGADQQHGGRLVLLPRRVHPPQ